MRLIHQRHLVWIRKVYWRFPWSPSNVHLLAFTSIRYTHTTTALDNNLVCTLIVLNFLRYTSYPLPPFERLCRPGKWTCPLLPVVGCWQWPVGYLWCSNIIFVFPTFTFMPPRLANQLCRSTFSWVSLWRLHSRPTSSTLKIQILYRWDECPLDGFLPSSHSS